jgi:hypothetical protein
VEGNTFYSGLEDLCSASQLAHVYFFVSAFVSPPAAFIIAADHIHTGAKKEHHPLRFAKGDIR